MPKVSDNTMRELEDILNESETYADRLAAFLKLKTAPKPQTNNPFVLGDLDISFDFDVDLVKLPSKPQPAAAAPTKAADAAKEQPLREIVNNGIPPATAEHKPQPKAPLVSPTQGNTAPTPPLAALTSPSRSSRSRSSFNVPGSDRLRRVAIQRRSRSCGRRDLLREFNNVTSSSSDFRQQLLSSTPVSEVKATAASEPKQPPGVASPAVAVATQSPPPSDHVTSVSQRSVTPDSSAKRRTYTIEMGPEPGQLLLSPSHKSSQRLAQQSPANATYTAALRQSRLRLSQAREQAELSAARLQILAPETPARTSAQTQPEPEYIVPETQPQKVLHSLGNNGLVTPFMVVPMAYLSPQPAKVAQVNAAAQVEPVAPVPTVASRSMQTSCNPQDLSEIMTEDESADERQASGAPLNLAPAGGHTSSRRQLRSRVQRVDSSMQLLDLHQSRSRDARNRGKCKPRQTVLNKPSKAPINGEQFAQELARMSNYEILDLRKRNSLGKLHPLNGNRQWPTEQQRVLEQHINWEISRRNLDEQPAVQASPLATKSARSLSIATTELASENDLTTATFVHSPAAPPMDFRDSSVLGRRLDSSKQLQRHSRFSRRETLTQTPAAPPDDFKDSSAQVGQPRRSRRSRRREPLMSEEDELLTVCTPPSQFRLSRSRSRSMREQQQLPESTVAAPPLEFIDVSETSAEEDLQQVELQLPPPAQFNNSLTEELADEQPSTTRAGQLSMRLNSSRRQSKLEKQRQKQEQKEQQEKEKQHQKEKEEKRKEKMKLKEKQQEKELQKEMLLQEQKQKEQQQKEEQNRLLKEKQQEEQLLEEKLLQEQEQKKQQQKEQKQKAQQQEQLQKEELLQEQQQREQEQNDKHQQEQLQQHQEDFTEQQQQPAQKQALSPPPEDVFKKPTAPAPRAKRNTKSTLENQLAKLRINLANETWSPDENQAPDNSNSGVRRSRRGQVQLCNTWVHTVSDPFKFMRKAFEPPKKPAANKSKKREAAAVANSISHRLPLSSSTPRNPTEPSSSGTTSKRKRDQQHEEQQHSHESSGLDAMSGISRLNSITEQDMQEQTVEKTPAPPTEPKKRGRKKNIPVESEAPKLPKEQKKTSKKNTPADVAATEMEQAESSMPAPAFPAAHQSHPQSDTLMAWLCGASEVPPETNDVSEIQTDSMLVSRAANLHFSNIDGIEYAFYNSEDRYSMGYMRFQPLQARGFKRAKTNTLRFVALIGQFEFEIISQNSTESYQDILYTGDTIEIKKGSRYNIKNRLDNVGVMMVHRSECA